jgi:hypothetical protein
MAAKAKTEKPKTTEKVVKPTPVKKVAKKSKPAAKATKKKASKKVVQPVITDKMFEDYFFKLSYTKFIELTEAWNEDKLKLRLQKQTTYDGWLNYFKTLSVNQLKLLSSTGLDILPAEAYAALSFWRDIMTNPSRIKNIHKAGLTGGETGKEKSITELAEANDRYGVLKAIRNQLANRMQNNPGNRDTADLSKQLTEVMTQIADYERRLAPDKKTVLGELLADMPKGSEVKDKRPSRNGGGHRQGSFASRVTIKDLEGKK